MILVIGETLIDVFPDYRRIGGAPFNFSYNLHQFGLAVEFVSRIGDDEAGSEILGILKRNEFDTRAIQVDCNHPTGKVMVYPDAKGGHRFEIVADVAYDYLELPEGPESLSDDPPELIYFGTLIQRTERAFEQVQKFLKNRSAQTRCFCDINLRPGCYTPETVDKSLWQTDILKINNEEIETVQNMFGSNLEKDEFIYRLMKQYRIEMVSLTSGSGGSEFFWGQSRYATSVPEFGPIADTVGAGDAYAAVLALGLLNNWPPEKIISEATEFSSRICKIQGAVSDDRSFYQNFINRDTGETYA